MIYHNYVIEEVLSIVIVISYTYIYDNNNNKFK